MNWDILITGIAVTGTALGIHLAKQKKIWLWSLKKRAYLRNGIGEGLSKYRSWEAVFENRKTGGLIDIIFRSIVSYRGKKIDKEIFESITLLRNLASIEKGRSSSADTIIEQLSEQSGLLQPVFIKMLNLLRVNKTKEAAALFALKTGTQAGRDFAGLLIQWDRLEPGELLETLLSYEKGMKAVRLTEQKRRDEMISDLIYFPVVVNILVIFINFIYVAYFLDQKEMLQVFM